MPYGERLSVARHPPRSLGRLLWRAPLCRRPHGPRAGTPPRGPQRTLAERIPYGFCRTYKPVLDDAPYRVFESMAEYRSWCEAHLPPYLGYKVVRE